MIALALCLEPRQPGNAQACLSFRTAHCRPVNRNCFRVSEGIVNPVSGYPWPRASFIVRFRVGKIIRIAKNKCVFPRMSQSSKSASLPG